MIEHKYEFFGHRALSLFSVSRVLALVTTVIEPIPSGADNATTGFCPEFTHLPKNETFADATKTLLAHSRGASARSSYTLHSTAHRALIGNDLSFSALAGRDFSRFGSFVLAKACLVKKDQF